MDVVKPIMEMFTPLSTSQTKIWKSALGYLAGKVLTILITIFVGVFATVLLANQPSPRGLGSARSPFEINLESQIGLILRINIANGNIPRLADGFPDQAQVDALTAKLRKDAGLDLPYLPRYLLWTIKALTFNWGELTVEDTGGFGLGGPTPVHRDVVLESLPNTLLLVGTAFLLTFLIGMPLSLYLSRNYGNWQDRTLSMLSPISSVPSWVIAILFIALFAVKLRWLPVGGRFDVAGPRDSWGRLLDLARHMVLPVSAIVLSILFQVVNTWRTFFILYSEEDYVDLARAKGLPSRILERQYILRPALPYVMTSFATILIGFWQLTVVLEAVFQWPGIGWLYIKEALPNFWGESIYAGQLMLVIEIVVIFAYLLGGVVFFLDLAYVLVDPRIHLLPLHTGLQGKVRAKPARTNWFARFKTSAEESVSRKQKQVQARAMHFSHPPFVFNFKETIKDFVRRSRLFFHEVRRYPSAIFGLTVIVVMFLGSFYAVIGLPYEQYGRQYGIDHVMGRSYAPRVAAPEWTNLFRFTPRLSRIILDENSPQANVTLQTMDNGWVEKTTTFTFEYGYKEIPSDVFVYFKAEYGEKIPFVLMRWITPDGRSINLKARSVAGDVSYEFEKGVPVFRLLNQNPEWKAWFDSKSQYTTPAFHLLFGNPGSTQAIPLHGTYQLEIKSLLFEPGNVHAELVLLGQVYGMAGTDFWRRDLIVPLMWGMPFALLIGLFGTFIMLLVAMLLPAVGVWFGGWLDDLIQRFTEINMILPGLTIAVLANALFGINIWVILGVVVMLNAFGSPIKTFRSALLQAKAAPYIEAARAYGVGDFRIITRYLVPRVLPVVIPQLVTQVPSFIFLEATLGFFNIRSNYPSWGNIIYEGLSRGALYGSPFWVLAPISLLLLTGFAFTMLGLALERILNPRMQNQTPESVKLNIP